VEEVEQAVGAGADEVLLPMIQTAEAVEAALGLAAGRCGVGILIETVRAVGLAEELAGLPLTRVYVGLNDLAIERRTPSIFAAVADGTVERVRAPFGFRSDSVASLYRAVASLYRPGCSSERWSGLAATSVSCGALFTETCRAVT